MATKSITITEEAYERLASIKEKNESFSDIINKLTKKTSYLDLVGLLSKEKASALREGINEARKRMRDNVDKTVRRMQ